MFELCNDKMHLKTLTKEAAPVKENEKYFINERFQNIRLKMELAQLLQVTLQQALLTFHTAFQSQRREREREREFSPTIMCV